MGWGGGRMGPLGTGGNSQRASLAMAAASSRAFHLQMRGLPTWCPEGAWGFPSWKWPPPHTQDCQQEEGVRVGLQ